MEKFLRRRVRGYLGHDGLRLQMDLGSRMLRHSGSHWDYLNIFLSRCSGSGKGGEDGRGQGIWQLWLAAGCASAGQISDSDASRSGALLPPYISPGAPHPCPFGMSPASHQPPTMASREYKQPFGIYINLQHE